MEEVQFIKSFNQIKIVSDPRRMSILRRLMNGPATLTQLSRALGEHPAWIRHHVKQLEQAGLVEMVATQIAGGFVEKYYQARARAFAIQTLILPESGRKDALILLGSHDLALNYLADYLRTRAHVELLLLPVGSLDGLIALRQGLAHLSACHLFHPGSGEYNLPFVRALFPERHMRLVTLAHRRQGLMLPPGNPRHIAGLEDLTRPGVVFIQRARGCATRLWLEMQLPRMGIALEQLRLYPEEAPTHTAVAMAVRQRRADVGLGLEAAARQFELDFIPLFQERFDLVIPEEQMADPRIQTLLNCLREEEVQRGIARLGGYDMHASGAQWTASA
jgi:putative molybdopterin biosynthesis protein